MSGRTDTKGLSSALLQMKFMQRTKVRLEEEAKRKSKQKLQKRFIKENDNKLAEGRNGPIESSVKFESRYDLLEDHVFGRMSFRGFNPEVEKLMKYYEDMKAGKVSDAVDFDGEKDVTDYELATSVFSLKTNEARKSQKKFEMHEKSLMDEVNEQPAKRKRRGDEF